jgi:DNA-binding PadR family transcriptional regulator
MRSFYGKLPETDFMKPIYRRLLASGFIRYARTKDGEISFKTTPAGRKAIQDVLDLTDPATHPDAGKSKYKK